MLERRVNRFDGHGVDWRWRKRLRAFASARERHRSFDDEFGDASQSLTMLSEACRT